MRLARFDLMEVPVIKACVVCDAEFDARGSQNTCSASCRSDRDRALRRLQKRRYYAKYPEKKRQERARARAREIARRETERPGLTAEERAKEAAIKAEIERARRSRSCAVCGSEFRAKNNVKTCSERCWLERHRKIRRRPERGLVPAERLAEKRRAAQELNDRRRAALRLISELQDKGVEVLL